MEGMITLVVASAVASLIVLLPGLAVSYVAGLRGWMAWGVAPSVGVGIIGSMAILGSTVGATWGVGVVAIGSVAATCAIWGLGWLVPRWYGPRDQIRGRGRLVLIVPLVTAGMAALLQARRLMAAIGVPDAIAQTFDTPFHLNSVRQMVESGDASSLHMTIADPGVSTIFYPGAWHGIVALITKTTGAPVEVAANAMTISISCVLWPLSLLALGRALFGPRWVLLGILGGLSFSMTQFPNQLIAFGVLYPNLLSYAIVPGVLAAAIATIRYSHGLRRAFPALLFAIGMTGLALAQPNAVFTVIYIAIPVILIESIRVSRKYLRRGGRPVIVAISATVAVGVAILVYAISDRVEMLASFRRNVSWPTEMIPIEAWKDALSLAAAHPSDASNVVITIFVVIGFVAALFVPRWRWLSFSYFILMWLFVIAISGESSYWRATLTGYWYADPERLASQLPVLALPLAAIGAWVVAHGLSDATRARSSLGRHRAWFSPALFSIIILLLVNVVLPRTMLYRDSFSYIDNTYAVPPNSWDRAVLVDGAERRMMEVVRRTVPEGVAIAGDPWDGSSLTWALAGRESVFPHTRMRMDQDRAVVANRLNDALADSTVCEAVERLDLGYVLDLGGRNLWDRQVDTYDGLKEIEGSGVAEIAAVSGPSVLYRITACD